MTQVISSKPSDVTLEGGSRPVAAVGNRRGIKLTRILAYIVVILFALVYIVPMLVLLNVSLKTPQEFLMDPTTLAKGLDFENYVVAWHKANFPAYIGNTLLYTLISTAIYTFVVLFVAFPIARKYVKGNRFLFTLYVIALFLPSGLIPQFQLMLRLGLYNTQPGYILLTIGGDIGVLMLVNYLRTLPRDLDEAAALDGCGYFRFVLQIVFPLIRPALATIALLHAIGIWNDLILPTIYLTKQAYYPITLGLITFYGQYGNEWTPLAAAVIMTIIPMVIIFIILQRYFIDGALMGAIKG